MKGTKLWAGDCVRDAIKDGSGQLAMLKRIEKRARRSLKDLHRIVGQLDPAMKQEIADGCEQIIGILAPGAVRAFDDGKIIDGD